MLSKKATSGAVMLYNLGDFLTELNLEAFIAIVSPAWAQSPSLHQQSGLGTLKQGHVWTQLGSKAFKDCFHLGMLGFYITVEELC